jgi:hypothetical protein
LAWEYMFPGEPVPHVIAEACCGQFAVSRRQVLARPRAQYERMRQWVIDTTEPDAVSGRVLEYFWHVIFGKEPVLSVSPLVSRPSSYVSALTRFEAVLTTIPVHVMSTVDVLLRGMSNQRPSSN